MALRDTARALEALPVAALEEAALAVVEVAEQLGSTVFGRRLSASYRIVATGAGTATATINGTPTAPWVWINDGTSAHVIDTRRRGGRRGPLMLKGAAHPVAGPVFHPGTSGRGAWRAVARAAEEIVPGHVADAVHEAVTHA